MQLAAASRGHSSGKVEAAGIEPASENYRREASTCLAHRFSFAGSKPGGPAQLSASLTEISLRRRQA